MGSYRFGVSWLQTRFRPSVHTSVHFPSNPDGMTNTALEATASSSGKNVSVIALLATALIPHRHYLCVDRLALLA